jgi:transposase-like protein
MPELLNFWRFVMSTASHTAARYNNEESARKHLESVRWPDGPVCPHCGGLERNSQLQGKSHRAGLYFCGDCRQQFTVTVGTVFEDSKVPLHKWLYANHLMCASKKGISSKQLERVLGVSYKTAWFMSHRLREAMDTGMGGPLGGNGSPVEVDETYWGNVGKQAPGARGWAHKMKVVSLVERNGQKRSFHVANVDAKTVTPILRAQVAKKARLMTDDTAVYNQAGKEFVSHEKVNSAGEALPFSSAACTALFTALANSIFNAMRPSSISNGIIASSSALRMRIALTLL